MGYSDNVKNTAGASGGQMMIRVADGAGTAGVINGNDVQFFVRSGSSATYVGSPGFGTSAFYNGAWHGLANVANHSNSTAWRHVGTVNIGGSQTVTFHINASGTSGFGGPDDFAVYVQRATVPPAPTVNAPNSFTHTSFRTNYAWAGDGGSGVDLYDIHYSNTPGGGQVSLGSLDGGQLVNVDPAVYPPGTKMYYWVRAHNAVGWGPFNGPQSGTLLPGIRVKVGGVWKNAIPYVKVAGVWKAAVVYIKKSGAWVSTTL